MTYSGFKTSLNKVIYDMLNDHRQFNMYKMITDFGHMLDYDALDMFLDIKNNLLYRKVTMM